jgi:very-short-patch-repair endonuclease
MRLYQNQPSGTVSRARSLRRNATDAERVLWCGLRETLPQAKWRRQVPVGPYFADFLSFSAKLVIEVDGSQHNEAADYDAERTAFLAGRGYKVLRFWNNDVLNNRDGVLASIAASLPLPAGEGRGEGDQPHSSRPSPSPSQAAPGPLPLPSGEGHKESI